MHLLLCKDGWEQLRDLWAGAKVRVRDASEFSEGQREDRSQQGYERYIDYLGLSFKGARPSFEDR